MQYWLLKSEPSDWSWEMQVGTSLEGESLTGVRNHREQRCSKQMLQRICSVQPVVNIEWNAIQKKGMGEQK